MRLPPGLPDDALPRWRHWSWYGHLVDLQDSRGVPGPRDVHLLHRALAEGERHGRGTVQLHAVGSSARRELRLLLLPRQRGTVRYLFPDFEADDPDVRRLEPLGVCRPVGHYVLPSLPGPAQLRSPQAWHEHGPVPAVAFLHERLCAAHVARLPAVPRVDRAGADPADVRREEHDVRGRPATRALLDGGGSFPRPHVVEGGG